MSKPRKNRRVAKDEIKAKIAKRKRDRKKEKA